MQQQLPLPGMPTLRMDANRIEDFRQGELGFAEGLLKTMQRVHVENGCLLIVRCNETMPPQLYHVVGTMLTDMTTKQGYENVRVLVVDRDIAIDTLTTESLARFGLVRLSDLRASGGRLQ